jgi:hypothetical protein
VARPTPYPIETLRKQIARLGTREEIKQVLQRIVPEYSIDDGC